MGRALLTLSLTLSLSLPFSSRAFDGGEFIKTPAGQATVGITAYTVLSGLTIVSQGESAIVERLGKFNRRLGPGISYVVPFVERVRFRESMRERILDIPPQPCITADNAPLMADAVVFFRILNLEQLVYAVDNLQDAVANIVLTQIRAEIGKLTLDDTFSNREALNRVLLQGINAIAQGWGILVTRIEVRDIQPSKEIQSSMELQMAAERKKRAAILESEGQRQATINAAEGTREAAIMRAEGDRRAVELRGEGLRQSLRSVQEGLKSENGTESSMDAAQVVLLQEYINAQARLAASSNAKLVMLPPSLKAALASLVR